MTTIEGYWNSNSIDWAAREAGGRLRHYVRTMFSDVMLWLCSWPFVVTALYDTLTIDVYPSGFLPITGLWLFIGLHIGLSVLGGELIWRMNAKRHREGANADEIDIEQADKVLAKHETYRQYVLRTSAIFGAIPVIVGTLGLIAFGLNESLMRVLVTFVGCALNAPIWLRLQWQSYVVVASQRGHGGSTPIPVSA
jgi:hypothetical protein